MIKLIQAIMFVKKQKRQAIKYFTNFISYGFFGDIIKHSENYRFLGPFRYKYSGFITFFKNR